MRVAALYDIHGNLPALEAVLQEVCREKVDRIVIGGDVFPGPLPVESISRLRALDIPVKFILGNGDREVLARMSGIETEWYRNAPHAWREPVRWTAEQLDRDIAGLLAGWPATCRMDIPSLGPVLFCHATPRNDTDIFTRLTPEELLLPHFASVDEPLVVCGHTHVQFDRRIGRTRVVNAGSVGMPFGAPGANWLLLGPDVELMRTDYDLSRAADRVRGSGYPRAEEFVAQNLLQPLREEVVLAGHGKVELK